MISARNQFHATVMEVKKGSVNTLVHMQTKNGLRVCATMTNSGGEALGLSKNDTVTAFFKASDIVIATGMVGALSGRNKLSGVIESLQRGVVSCEVAIRAPKDERLLAMITNSAADDLALRAGDTIVAIIKSGDVMIAKH